MSKHKTAIKYQDVLIIREIEVNQRTWSELGLLTREHWSTQSSGYAHGAPDPDLMITAWFYNFRSGFEIGDRVRVTLEKVEPAPEVKP
jgi:hypothetical protein